MERTTFSRRKAPATKPRITWINKGGTFRMGTGKIIKPNEKFLAYPDEIPAAFRDVLKPVEALPAEPAPQSVGHYELKERDDSQYDIIDSQGKVVNEAPMTLEDAKEILAKLE